MSQETQTGALYQPRGMGWGGRFKREGIYVYLEEGNGNPLQYSSLENPMDREAWQATVHGVAKSWTRLSLHAHIHTAAAKSHQSCPTLCDPIDGSPADSSVPGILQARILEWVAISFSVYLPNPGIKPGSPALQGDSLPTEPPGKSFRDNKGC